MTQTSAPEVAPTRARLLYVVTDPITAAVLMRDQLSSLRNKGFEVGVLSSPGERLAEVATREGVWTAGVPISRRVSPLADLVSLARLWRAMRRWRPDIVNASTPKAGLLGMLAARLARVPLRVYAVRGLPSSTATGWRRHLYLTSERVAISCAHRVIAVSASLGRELVELGLCSAAAVGVLGNGSSAGVDITRFRANERDGRRQELRSLLAIPASAPIMGFVGRLSRDKGLADLAEAFARVTHWFPEVRLLLLGANDVTDPVDHTLMERLRSDSRVVLTGFVDDPERYYRLMDVLVFPSYREGFPNAALEAAASAVPVAGYAATGTVDAVLNGQTGTLVPVGQVENLAAAIRSYLEDPALRKQHGQAARERVERDFQRSAVSRAWANEYRRMLATSS